MGISGTAFVAICGFVGYFSCLFLFVGIMGLFIPTLLIPHFLSTEIKHWNIFICALYTVHLVLLHISAAKLDQGDRRLLLTPRQTLRFKHSYVFFRIWTLTHFGVLICLMVTLFEHKPITGMKVLVLDIALKWFFHLRASHMQRKGHALLRT